MAFQTAQTQSSPLAFAYSLNLVLKLGTALLVGPGPAENCSISSPVRLSIQKQFLALDEAFKKASYIAS